MFVQSPSIEECHIRPQKLAHEVKHVVCFKQDFEKTRKSFMKTSQHLKSTHIVPASRHSFSLTYFHCAIIPCLLKLPNHSCWGNKSACSSRLFYGLFCPLPCEYNSIPRLFSSRHLITIFPVRHIPRVACSLQVRHSVVSGKSGIKDGG